MRALAIACALVALCATSARADDLAVPHSTLESMGLAAMQPLSDDAGQNVRGEGIFDGIQGAIQVFIRASMGLSDISRRFPDFARMIPIPFAPQP